MDQRLSKNTSVVKDIIFPYIVATRVIVLWRNPCEISGKGLLKSFLLGLVFCIRF